MTVGKMVLPRADGKLNPAARADRLTRR